MALIITPGQFSRRAEFYQQLSGLTSAGLGLVAALGQLERKPPARSYREPIRQTLQGLAEGSTLTESLGRLDCRWLPAFDVTLLQAGEQSGRLDASFRLLADYYADRARIARQLIADLTYPAFVFHFAVFILPFSQFFLSGNWVRYLCQTAGVLVPIYAVIGLVVYAAQSRHGERWRALVERVLHPVPVLGMARRDLALGRLAGSLEALLNAGVSVVEGWELAAAASGSPALRRAVLAWRPQVEGGQTPAEALGASRQFPELFANQYATGEISGRLDETLGRLHRYYQEEGSRKLHALARWFPRAVYLVVMILIAYRIVSWWGAYFQQIQDVGKF
ncbi:MAG: type II secretion system F family protein [Verrucomicrobiota bacterium]|jgi:type II secretory pathway component PulF